MNQKTSEAKIAAVNDKIREYERVIRELEASGQGDGPPARLFQKLIEEKVWERRGLEQTLNTEQVGRQ